MKIKLSALVSDARGKLNGSYMARSQHGLVLRNKITPSNPKTSKQQSHRNVFSWVGRLWNKLTAEQREQWRDYAKTQPFNNDFNDRQHLTGNALFIQRNMNLYSAGLPPLTTPSNEVVVFPPIDAEFVLASGQSYFIKISDVIPDGYVLNIYASPPHSVAVIKNETSFRIIANITENDLENRLYNIYNDYRNVFGKSPTNVAIDLKLQLIAPNGKQSLPTFIREKTSEEKPFFLYFDAYPVDNNQASAIVAEIGNSHLFDTPEWVLYIGYASEPHICPLPEERGIAPNSNVKELIQDKITVLTNLIPDMECIFVQLIAEHSKTLEIIRSDGIYINVNDLPYS